MKRFLSKALVATICAASVSACSSGGGSNSSPVPAAPTPTPAPIVANTSNSAYLPLDTGNTWTFSTGGKIVDMGTITLSCTCPQNGKTFEQHDFLNPSGAYAGSFILGKGAWPLAGSLQGHRVTYLIGTTSDHGATIQLAFESFDGSVTGYPIMDDSPSAGEIFAYTSTSGAVTTTFSTVGSTQPYGSNAIIKNIADTVVSGTGISTPVALDMAQGVGYTALSANNMSTQLTSFSINAAQSQSIRFNRSAVVVNGVAQPASILQQAL